ncbi:sulfatase-like hydrolase/transferase [Planctomycetota bacterium]
MNTNHTRRIFLKNTISGAISLALLAGKKQDQRPNILWIVSEDNSPLLGCYGDSFATTPNLDRLAGQGVLYENAFANTPVCAPARATILTGMYACSLGTHHMRSRYRIPSFIKPYPEYLRQADYYCTNKSKTDYNIQGDDKKCWDECSGQASYRNRRSGQPFFCIFNLTTTHESSIHKKQATTRHDPAGVSLPPYHPDTPEIRHDWAQYYDKIEAMDGQVGKILDDLTKDGLAEDTIVFYYADHGGVLCRSKRFLYDTGTRVPLIIRFPKKYEHLVSGRPGSRTDRIVSFVDLAPTLLSLADIKIPDYMQGEAFLGAQQKKPREYAHLYRGRMDERYDMMRAVRDKKYKYIRNYMPHRIYGQHLEYLWLAASTRSWEKQFKQGRCNKTQSIFWQTKPPEELYEIASDPWEVNNLAGDPRHRDVLERMRQTTMKWVRQIHDPGFIPEGEMIERSAGKTNFGLVREKSFPLDRIIETAEMATTSDAQKLPELIRRLEDQDSAVRFWAATGCVILGEKAGAAEAVLMKTLEDNSADVRIAAAEALCLFGKEQVALPILITELQNGNSKIALNAINTLDVLGEKARAALGALESVNRQSNDEYIPRAAAYIINKLKK